MSGRKSQGNGNSLLRNTVFLPKNSVNGHSHQPRLCGLCVEWISLGAPRFAPVLWTLTWVTDPVARAHLCPKKIPERSGLALPVPQLTLAPKVRTITHLPPRFSSRSTKTNCALISCPS